MLNRKMLHGITLGIAAAMLAPIPCPAEEQASSGELEEIAEIETIETENGTVEQISETEQAVTQTAAKPFDLGPWDLPIELSPEVRIRKIYDFLNDPDRTKTGKDEALKREFEYYNWGAVTKAQKRSKLGHYYVVNWENQGDVAHYELRFDYRQSKTREKVRTLTIPYPNAKKGSHKARFSVTGDAYLEQGPLTSWRVSLVRNGIIVAQEKSFVW